ncbi:MAG TPA: tyrosine--tRNA ligase, partial [Caulobacteraceae bacterium]
AADFLELHRRHGCTLQFGGSEQWGNIVNGVDLIRRMAAAEAFGVTAPLITTGSGVKMGKTVAGAVWLNPELLGAYDYWQFWRNTEDADVGRFLKMFTDLPLAEIARLEALKGAEINEAKKTLAIQATALLHGEAAAAVAAETARTVFEVGLLSDDLPTVTITGGVLDKMTHADLMVQVGFASSKGDARRQIAGGGFRIDGKKLVDPNKLVEITAESAELRRGQVRKRLLVRR